MRHKTGPCPCEGSCERRLSIRTGRQLLPGTPLPLPAAEKIRQVDLLSDRLRGQVQDLPSIGSHPLKRLVQIHDIPVRDLPDLPAQVPGVRLINGDRAHACGFGTADSRKDIVKDRALPGGHAQS